MPGLEVWIRDLILHEQCQIIVSDPNPVLFVNGGLFLEPTISSSFVRLISTRISANGVSSSFDSSSVHSRTHVVIGGCRRERRVSKAFGSGFLSVSLGSDGFAQESTGFLVRNGDKGSEEGPRFHGGNAVVEEGEKRDEVRVGDTGAMNATKHLWAGAVSAMVSRSVFFTFIYYFFLFFPFHSRLLWR